MDINHPIMPPPFLLNQWRDSAYRLANDRSINPSAFDIHSLMMIQAAQWAADTELEACCELVDQDPHSAQTLRRERRSFYRGDAPTQNS